MTPDHNGNDLTVDTALQRRMWTEWWDRVQSAIILCYFDEMLDSMANTYLRNTDRSGQH